MINRRQLFQSVVASPVLRNARPNILFLMTDEHRFDCVGYAEPGAAHAEPRPARRRECRLHARLLDEPLVRSGARGHLHGAVSVAVRRAHLHHVPASGRDHLHEPASGCRLLYRGHRQTALRRDGGPPGIRLRGSRRFRKRPRSTSYTRFLAAAGIRPKQMRKPSGRFASAWQADQRYHIDDFVGEQARSWLGGPVPAGPAVVSYRVVPRPAPAVRRPRLAVRKAVPGQGDQPARDRRSGSGRQAAALRRYCAQIRRADQRGNPHDPPRLLFQDLAHRRQDRRDSRRAEGARRVRQHPDRISPRTTATTWATSGWFTRRSTFPKR